MTNTQKIFDSYLVLEYQRGNQKAVTLLVKRWHPKLCKQAYWYTKDMDKAKDIAQDSWGVIFRKIDQIQDLNSFGSWALKIVTRKSLDWLRTQKKELKNLEDHYENYHSHSNVAHYLAIDTALVALSKAIRKMPEKHQMILNLFYLEEQSIKQIRDILHISEGTVKSRLFTARENLKTLLKNRNYEE